MNDEDFYSHTDHEEVIQVAKDLEKIPIYRFGNLIPAIISVGLMRFPLTVRIIVWIISKWKGIDKDQIYKAMFNSQSPGANEMRNFVIDFKDSLIHHLLNGHDKTDTTSVGGFNKEEFISLQEIIKHFGYLTPKEEFEKNT